MSEIISRSAETDCISIPELVYFMEYSVLLISTDSVSANAGYVNVIAIIASINTVLYDNSRLCHEVSVLSFRL